MSCFPNSLRTHLLFFLKKGGYNLTSISESMAACTRTLLGDPPPLLTLPRPPLSGALASIAKTIQIHRKYWRSLRVTSEWVWGIGDNEGLRGGWGLEAGEELALTLKDLPPMVPEFEDKEGPSSSKSIKEAPQPANPGLAEKLTTLEGNILDATMEKDTSASSVQESTPAQNKSQTAVVELTQDQPSEAAKGEPMLDQTTSKAVTLDQTTSEEAVEIAKLIHTPPAPCSNNQTPPTSPVQGATAQISLSKLIGNLRTLELDSKAQVRPTSTPT